MPFNPKTLEAEMFSAVDANHRCAIHNAALVDKPTPVTPGQPAADAVPLWVQITGTATFALICAICIIYCLQ